MRIPWRSEQKKLADARARGVSLSKLRKASIITAMLEKGPSSTPTPDTATPTNFAALHSPAGVGRFVHQRARFAKPDDYPARLYIPDELVPWEVLFPGYNPPYYVSPKVLAQDRTKRPDDLSLWADPEDISLMPRPFLSYEGPVRIEPVSGLPLNVKGRTGIRGRGALGAWGGNQAADVLLSRINPGSLLLELLLVIRGDTGLPAPPGGFCSHSDGGVRYSGSRELREETRVIQDLAKALIVYQGYVDDFRNTDNAWIETTAFHLHLPWEEAGKMIPVAGDDAKDAAWVQADRSLLARFCGNHGQIVKLALRSLLLTGTLQAPARMQLEGITR
jgi:ADP-ribose pyrophosphatase